MELWIRSQDKRILQKVDNIFLDANYGNKRICSYDNDNRIELGTYKTKERAIEVLDEIQNILIGKYMISLDYKNALGSNFTSKQIQEVLKETSVYQMPDK